MNYPHPLVRGQLIRRYKRFLCDVRLDDGLEVQAHVANPGAMTGLAEAGMEVWLAGNHDPRRKLAWSWKLVRQGRHLVGVDTGLANRIVEEALGRGRIPSLADYTSWRREVRYGDSSRVDFLLQDRVEGEGKGKGKGKAARNGTGPKPAPGAPMDTGRRRRDCYLEIKSVTLKRGPVAVFPDSVTLRGTRHLHDLRRVAAAGSRAVMLYLVQRSDCEAFDLARDIDPAYAEACQAARKDGVEILCFRCRVGTRSIALDSPLPVAI